jgi:uncharacterized membrane protein
LLAHGWWFSPGTPASSITKTGRHDVKMGSINKYVQVIRKNTCINVKHISVSTCNVGNLLGDCHSYSTYKTSFVDFGKRVDTSILFDVQLSPFLGRIIVYVVKYTCLKALLFSMLCFLHFFIMILSEYSCLLLLIRL